MGNSFMRGRELAKNLMTGLVISAVLSILSLYMMSGIMQIFFLVLTTVLVIVLAYVVVKFCRCPYCDKVIIAGVLAVQDCPRCHRNLVTGKKTKKSKR